MALALFVINGTSPNDYVLPHDPIFFIPLNDLFWIIGGIAAVTALVCLFSKRPALPIFLLVWLTTNFLVYQIGLFCKGCHSLTGFLGGFSSTFGISAKTANDLANVIFAYLLMGSYSSLFWLWFWKNEIKPGSATLTRSQTAAIETLKMACVLCKGGIEFSSSNLGQKIACPHCKATITLMRPKTLKMTCSSCGEHIEFPIHGIGETVTCPHCSNTITLHLSD